MGGVLGEGAGGGGFGARQLVVEVAGVCGRVECGSVSARTACAATGVDVVFGDDVVDAAGGVDEFGAGCVEAVARGVARRRRRAGFVR